MSGPNDNTRDARPPWDATSPAAYPYQNPHPQSAYPPPPSAQYPPPHYHPSSNYPPPAPQYAMYPHPDPYQQGQYGAHGPQGAATHAQQGYQQAAPRQRTAIACRYCRRRKIRCSGFDTSTDGRCTNCIRFNQECMFTPVSSQHQAFVPAQALKSFRHEPGPGQPPVLLYGAHGQPLPPGQQHHESGREGEPILYGAHGQPLPPLQQQQGSLPPPQGMYNGGPLAQSDPRYRDSNTGFQYPDPTNLAPVTPTSRHPQSYSYPPPPTHPPTHDRRSPPSAYAYNDARHSSSPHGSPYSAQLAPMTPHQVGPVPGIQSGSIAQSSTPQPGGGMTPPPASTPSGSQRPGGLNVRDMLNPESGRSSTDSDMLNALNRRGPQ